MKREPHIPEVGYSKLLCLFYSWILVLGGGGLGSWPLSSKAASETLGWDVPINEDNTSVTNIAGYRLYYGTNSQVYSDVITVGATPTATATNLLEGTTYYFAVVAFNDAGAESSFSQELATMTPPVLKLTALSALTDLSRPGHVLQWASATGKYYTVMRSTNLMATPAFSNIVSHIEGLESITSYTDLDATTNGPYFYQIQVEP